jgi:MerR family transcriptional regulator, light-induced transcriptional regulator
MDDNFSPKQVAEALSVSESSIKRWCDRGAIATTKTHGGHRRITLAGLMAFLEASDRQVLDPYSLGIGKVRQLDPPRHDREQPQGQQSNAELKKVRDHFENALIRGDEKECRKSLSHFYAACQSFAMVCDEFIAPAFHRLGALWHNAEIEIFQERRACEICSRLVHEFRRLLMEPPATAPLAIGASIAGDYYSLPSQLVEVVLRESGWRAINIGSNLPLKSLEAAVRRDHPKLVWLSVSHVTDDNTFVSELHEFWASIPRDVTLVVGGRVLNDELRPKLRYTAHCDTLQQLSTLALALKGG